MIPTNRAAFYPSDKAPSLTIKESPYPVVGEDEIIVKVAAVAINHVDYLIQDLGTNMFPFLKFPLVGGLDIAGTVVEVGSKVTRFHPGDRVLGFSLEFAPRSGGFQHYAAVTAAVAATVPQHTPLVDAAVLPSGISTAAVALYQYLGLEQPPTIGAAPARGQTVLISGGASAVGSNAIQLAVMSGYEVFTTASRRNFAHCEALGASRVFDYRDPGLARDLREALGGRRCAGALSCIEESNGLVFDMVGAAGEGSNKAVACTILNSDKEEGVPAEIRAEMIHAHWIKDTPLANVIYGSFLPAALESGRYKCEPRPRVVGKGLESIQAALDVGRANMVSCEKLVVTLEK